MTTLYFGQALNAVKKKRLKGNNSDNTKVGYDFCNLHFPILQQIGIPCIKSIQLKMTKLCSEQARNATKRRQKGNNSYLPFVISQKSCIPNLKSLRLEMTKPHSEQAENVEEITIKEKYLKDSMR